MTNSKFLIFLSLVLFSLLVNTSATDVFNTCGNTDVFPPRIHKECTGISIKDGKCCYVRDVEQDISYCVLLYGNPREEALKRFSKELGGDTIIINCHSEYLTISMILLLIVGLFF
jgi:hypothetical protein